MRGIWTAFFILLCFVLPVRAADQGFVVAVCGTLPNAYVAGAPQNMTIDVNGNLCQSSSGGGGGAITAAINSYAVGALQDGADVTQGTKADTAYAGSGSATVVSILKGIYAALVAPLPAGTNNIGNVGQVSPYPATAVPITASATGTTGATTATLTNVSGHTTYICGFSIRANATAAATNNATVTGTITGTLNFTQWTAPLASGIGVTEEIFSPCVPASAVSTSIAVVSGAPGSGGVVSVTAWGYSI
jgi:hypothetical protein